MCKHFLKFINIIFKFIDIFKFKKFLLNPQTFYDFTKLFQN